MIRLEIDFTDDELLDIINAPGDGAEVIFADGGFLAPAYPAPSTIVSYSLPVDSGDFMWLDWESTEGMVPLPDAGQMWQPVELDLSAISPLGSKELLQSHVRPGQRAAA